MKYQNDERIVMTLDAGGTNFVFSAMKGGEQIVDEIIFPSNADNLELSLKTIVNGFTKVKENLSGTPSAISFAFPGPADYPNGILGDLGNLPGYRGGVALGPMLQEKFGLPVFINNDGDLYAYGESIAGLLPQINNLLEKAGSPKRYKNLLGLTLGTGFGAGIVRNGELYIGDNSMAGEIWLLRNKVEPNSNVEELASIRGVQRIFADKAGIDKKDSPSPKEIFEIAAGKINGNKDAAVEAFKQMAAAVSDAICNAVTLLDGLVVIGGGLAGASSLFMPYIINEMKSDFILPNGKRIPRLVAKVYNFEDETDLQNFAKGSAVEITVPGS
ncbi:MAG: hypothetical protein A2068_03160, partial [Ignavibacteria bacterium GWB2_35_6b]